MTTEQKHTPGPWVASRCENEKEWGIDSGEWGIATCADCPGDGTPEANARRIVACVNACEGSSTEWLEAFANMPVGVSSIEKCVEHCETLLAKIKELDAQRDELLKAINNYLNPNYSPFGLAQTDKDNAHRALVNLIEKIEAEKK